MDDILIYSDEYEEHIQHVHSVLRKLENADLIVAPQKCEWLTQQVDWLGYRI